MKAFLFRYAIKNNYEVVLDGYKLVYDINNDKAYSKLFSELSDRYPNNFILLFTETLFE